MEKSGLPILKGVRSDNAWLEHEQMFAQKIVTFLNILKYY